VLHLVVNVVCVCVCVCRNYAPNHEPKIQKRVLKRLTLVNILSRMNSVHVVTASFRQIHRNAVLLSIFHIFKLHFLPEKLQNIYIKCIILLFLYYYTEFA
jgi:hypothetical protein